MATMLLWPGRAAAAPPGGGEELTAHGQRCPVRVGSGGAGRSAPWAAARSARRRAAEGFPSPTPYRRFSKTASPQALIKALALAKEQRNSAIQQRDEHSAELFNLREEVGQLQSERAKITSEAKAAQESLDRELSAARATMNETLSELLKVRQARKTAVSFGCQAGTSFVSIGLLRTGSQSTPMR